MLDMLPQRPAHTRMAEQVGRLARGRAVTSSLQVPGATRRSGRWSWSACDLFHELVRFETELWNALDARLRTDLDLPMTWFEPMRVIAGRPSCRVFDIAEELSLTVGGTSKLVDRIEAAGHCVRRANPDDRRSSIIELTPGGRRLLASAVAAFEEELRLRIGSAVPGRSLEQFYTTLTSLRAANARPGDTRSSA